jgi:UDP-glucose 4-epimerase
MSNSKSKIVYIPYEKAFEKGFEDMRRRVPDITKLNHLIGYKPRVSLEASIEKIIANYRE